MQLLDQLVSRRDEVSTAMTAICDTAAEETEAPAAEAAAAAEEADSTGFGRLGANTAHGLPG